MQIIVQIKVERIPGKLYNILGKICCVFSDAVLEELYIMEVLEWTREHKIEEAKKMALALLGILAFCIGVNWFIVPIGLYNGGFVGIGQVVRTALIEYAHMDFGDIDIAGFIYFACNVPLFFLAYKSLGKMFFVKTVICVVVQTFLLSLLKSPEVPIIEDRLAACLIGGIIAGWGVGLTLKNGGSGGGQDILGVYCTKKLKNFSVGKLSLIINAGVYGACALMFDLTVVIYSLIYTAILSMVIDQTHSQNITVEVTIYTKTKSQEIRENILEVLGRGCTYWEATGNFTDSNTTIITTIISKYEVTQLMRNVHLIDPNAFVVVKDNVHVDGYFIKRL